MINVQVDEYDDDRDLLEELYGIPVTGLANNIPMPTAEDISLLKRIIAIRKNAMRCRNSKSVKPEWNSAVHYPLM